MMQITLTSDILHWLDTGRRPRHWPQWYEWPGPGMGDYACERCGGHPWPLSKWLPQKFKHYLKHL